MPPYELSSVVGGVAEEVGQDREGLVRVLARLRIRNVSALKAAVVVPLYDGIAARFQSSPASVTQHTFHRKFSLHRDLAGELKGSRRR